MTTTPRYPLAEEYLSELGQRAARLPRRDREELLAELRAHVDVGVAEARSEADIRNMLEALGSPEDIVAASMSGRPTTGPTGRLALTFGVLALVLVPTPLFGFVATPFAIPFGITAVVLGVRARRYLRSTAQPTSAATAGAVTGGIAVAIPVLLLAVFVPVRSTGGSSGPPPGEPSPVTVSVPTTTGAG